jgi:hypothetical protein
MMARRILSILQNADNASAVRSGIPTLDIELTIFQVGIGPQLLGLFQGADERDFLGHWTADTPVEHVATL